MIKKLMVFFGEVAMTVLMGMIPLIALFGGFSVTFGALTIEAHRLTNPGIALIIALALRRILAGSFFHDLIAYRVLDRLRGYLQASPQRKQRALGVLVAGGLLTALTVFVEPMPSGLTGAYYPNAAWRDAPLVTVREQTLDLRRMKREFPAATTDYSIQWTGVLYIAAAGDYQFATISDDGSELWLDGRLVVDNRGRHGVQRQQGQIALTPGFHAIRIRYVQGGGGATLSVAWKPPGKSSRGLSSAPLFASPPAHAIYFWLFQVRRIVLPLLLLLWCPGLLLVGLSVFRLLREKRQRSVARDLFWTPQVLMFIAVFLLLMHTYLFRNYITDDAFISFRYLENLMKGNGLVYNVGEKVWGYTNFLWIMVLFPFTELHIDPLLQARVISVSCNILTLCLVLIGFRQITIGTPSNILGALLLVSYGPFVLQSMSGLETSFFTFLVLLGLFLYKSAINTKNQGLYYWVGMIMALAALTRPEGIFIFCVLLIHIVVYHNTIGLQLTRAIRKPLTGFLPIVVIFTIGMFSYYGVFWPNSLNAKVGLSSEQFLRGIWYYKAFAMRYPIHVLLLGMAAFFWKDANVIVKGIFRISVFLILFNIIVGGDWMFGYRLFHTLIPLTCLLVPFCMASLQKKFVRQKVLPECITKALPIFLIILFSLLNLSNSKWDPKVFQATWPSYVQQGIKVGTWMREHFMKDSLLATNTGGTIAYYSKLPIIDMMGLNDPVIANRRNVPKAWKGIEKGDGKYVLSRSPQYIQFRSAVGSIEPVFLSDIEIFTSRDFWQNYELVEYFVDEKTRLLLYKRREQEWLTELSEQEFAKIRQIADQSMRNSAFRY